MFLTFIDYKQAFDSIHRDTLWRILEHYGIPQKIINIMKAFDKDNEVAVIHGSNTSEWFSVKSGVKQGCVMSGFLFLLVIDWIMRKAIHGRTGIRWNLMDVLEDLDYADDIVTTSTTHNRNWKTLPDIAQKPGCK